jgi:hypothetical protein
MLAQALTGTEGAESTFSHMAPAPDLGKNGQM